MENRKKIRIKLQRELIGKCVVTWNLDKDDSPLRIKSNEHNKSDKLQSVMNRWIDAISQAAKTKPIQLQRYIRINLESDDSLAYATIYGNGTIMFQPERDVRSG